MISLYILDLIFFFFFFFLSLFFKMFYCQKSSSYKEADMPVCCTTLNKSNQPKDKVFSPDPFQSHKSILLRLKVHDCTRIHYRIECKGWNTVTHIHA